MVDDLADPAGGNGKYAVQYLREIHAGERERLASLTISYAVAALCSVAMFFLTRGQKNLAAALGQTNWTSYALGVAIVGLEFGFICIYRAGWKISVGNLVASISLACVLLLVGVLLYRESLSVRQMIGLLVCAAGLILIAK